MPTRRLSPIRYEPSLCGVKANGRKVKINAILDDASNETFLNEEVAGVLGLQEPFQKVQVHVLNDTVETFQSMPLKIEIESVDERFSKEISIKTCPQKVTDNYRVVNWSEYQQMASPDPVQFCQASKRWSCRSFDWN